MPGADHNDVIARGGAALMLALREHFTGLEHRPASAISGLLDGRRQATALQPVAVQLGRLQRADDHHGPAAVVRLEHDLDRLAEAEPGTERISERTTWSIEFTSSL